MLFPPPLHGQRALWAAPGDARRAGMLQEVFKTKEVDAKDQNFWKGSLQTGGSSRGLSPSPLWSSWQSHQVRVARDVISGQGESPKPTFGQEMLRSAQLCN